MTEILKPCLLADAELLTATGEDLYADSWTRHRNAWEAFTAQRDAIVRAATAKVRAEYEAKLATARTAALRISSLAIVSPQASPDDVKVLLECLSAILELAPAPREEAVTDVLDLAVWGKGPGGEDIPCNLRLTPKDAAAIVALARVAGREP